MADQINPDQESVHSRKTKYKKGKPIWVIIGIVALVLVVVGAGGGYTLHLSNTNPQFCSICHPMEKYVTSYLSSRNLDNVHYQAGVQCKECHDYPLPDEVSTAIKFIFGRYYVRPNGELLPVSYEDDMCLKCHISKEHLAIATDFLAANPHKSHLTDLACNTCHISHGAQIDYCGQCHKDTGQRMVGGEIIDRGKLP